MEFSSKLLENAVNEMSQLPGIGKRTALRLVLHMLRQPENQTFQLAEALSKVRSDINFCKSCHNISDTVLCGIDTETRPSFYKNKDSKVDFYRTSLIQIALRKGVY